MSRSIAIVGAGAAGLTTAWSLKKRGYSNVKLFERRDRVGGKCLTVDIDNRNYELGAVIVGRTTYEVVNTLIQEFGLNLTPMETTTLLDSSRGGTVGKLGLVFNFLLKYRGPLKRFLKEVDAGPAFSEPGFLGFAPEQFGYTFAEWAKRENIEPLVELFAPIYTGFGYGYLDQISAPQFLKIYDQARIDKTFSRKPGDPPAMFTLDEGYQGLWEKVAAEQDVQLNASIRKITRDDHITITTDQGEEQFDALVLACPLHAIRDVLDLDAEEAPLYNKATYLDYQTITADVDGLGPEGLMFMVDNMTSDRAGHLVCGYRRWEESPTWALYALSDGSYDDPTIIERVKSDLEAVGATLTKVHRHDKWDFYPHVTPEDFRAGFYPDLEAKQGQRSTYIVGELMGAACVESTSNYAHQLVMKHFADQS